VSGAAAEGSGSHDASRTGGGSSGGQAWDGASTSGPAPAPPPAPPPTTRSGRAVRTPGHLRWGYEEEGDGGGPPPPLQPASRGAKRAAPEPPESHKSAAKRSHHKAAAPKAPPPKPAAVPFANARTPETLHFDGWLISAQEVRELARKGRYLVEDVVSRRQQGGATQYLVKWLVFSDAERTWEPAASLLAARESRAYIAARIERLDAALDSLAALKGGR